ncbi:hypothetical protein FH039_03420 [Thermococcus indicus]|uniref:Uncharacterized protein n=1 Tax=Thermococcus indicus TaxID=2586643 RepID=A0A4Y5SLK5_9EURY|nr:hypothetical protein [Thermococcus indicus]QDA30850.1 hypothetical protein FH039_03420 [Thermococcus indicus]
MARRFIISVTFSVLISFFAWLALQPHFTLGIVLFISAVLLPPIVFRGYYGKKPRMLVPFLITALLLMLLMAPPPVTAPNVEFGLHFATGCWEREEDTWPLNEGELTYSCNETVAYSTIHVGGVAWKSVRVELPVVGRFVTIYEPMQKAEEAYRKAIERVESKGYIKLAENYGMDSDIIGDVIFAKGDECVYLAKTRVLGGGLAVVSAKGPCRGVKGFALRWHDDYLWNVSEPPTFEEYRFNWSQKGGVRVGWFAPKDWPDEWVGNTYTAIGIELKGTGYVKVLDGKGERFKWSLWTRGEKSYYVALRDREILVIGGKAGEIEKTAEEVSPCGLKNGRRVEWKTPGEVLLEVTGELGENFAPRQVSEPAIWSLAGGRFELDENLSLTILVYGTGWQCHYARYLLDTPEGNTTSICIEREGYFVAVAVRGDYKSVNAILSSISRPKKI